MIELRWLERPACTCAEQNRSQTAWGCGCSRCGITERVLQYRTGGQWLTDAYGHVVGREWSEWRDVPTEVAPLGAESAAQSDDTGETKSEAR